MPNFARAPEKSELLGADLASSEPSDGRGAEFILNGFEAQSKELERGVPIGRLKLTELHRGYTAKWPDLSLAVVKAPPSPLGKPCQDSPDNSSLG